MKFLMEVEFEPVDGGQPFTVDQVKQHLVDYTFADDVEFEMSLIPDNGSMETVGEGIYRRFVVTHCEVEPVQP